MRKLNFGFVMTPVPASLMVTNVLEYCDEFVIKSTARRLLCGSAVLLVLEDRLKMGTITRTGGLNGGRPSTVQELLRESVAKKHGHIAR